MRGNDWKSKLVHVEYENESISARHEHFFNLDRLIKLDDGLYGVTETSPLKSKIIKVIAFSLDLELSKLNSIKEAKQILKHHFIEAESEAGRRFTLEKGPECILLQSCYVDDDGIPIIRLQRDGERRPTINTLKDIKTEEYPKVRLCEASSSRDRELQISSTFIWLNQHLATIFLS